MGRILTQDSPDLAPEREFELTEKDFKFIQWFMHKQAGIYFSDRKQTMVYGRVSRQMRRLKLKRFEQYREIIEQSADEQVNFINSLTTNKTEFFREYHHFRFLEQVMIEKWLAQEKQSIRVWSAGCSTGEEPYSYISSLYHAGAFDLFGEVSLTATDLDTKVLETARRGVYSDEAVRSIPDQYLASCFFKGKGAQAGNIKVAKGLQQHIRFRQLNLLEEWPFEHAFELISCRNVMIYFDKQTQEALIRRFHQQLKPGGVLIIGHSESIGNCTDIFRHLGKTIYAKL